MSDRYEKYKRVVELSDDTSQRIVQTPEEWMRFLTTASRIYKYRFSDQLLIYAQKPQATACTSIEVWNEKMNCWVNRGAKGIALIDRESKYPRLRYVFDVSDVHKAKRIGKDPYIWEMRMEHQPVIIKKLEEIYGITDPKLVFEERILEIGNRIAEDYSEDILTDLLFENNSGAISNLDESGVRFHLKETLAESISFTLLSRLGADIPAWREKFSFSYIHEFDNTVALSIVGNAVSDMCRPILHEIGIVIARYDHEIHQNPEKKIEKGIAITPNTDYNALKHKSVDGTHNNEETNHIEKGETTNGADIREERGLSDSAAAAQRGAGGGADQVRSDETQVHGGTPEGNLRGTASDREAEGTLPEHPASGRGENGSSGGADGQSRGSEREAEGIRSDAVGTPDEQHPGISGGDRVAGDRADALTHEEPNIETQETDSEADSLSVFSSDLMKAILCADTHLIHKRPEIAGYFQSEQDSILQTEYLKNSFRMEEFTELLLGDVRVGYRADGDGLTIWKGNYLTREAESRLSWEEARYWVNSYIEDGVYLLPGETAEQIDTNGMFQQMDLFTMFSEQVGSISVKQAEEKVAMPVGFSLPDKHLEEILRSGGGRDHSRKRIYAKYQQQKSPEEITEFLKNEYRTTGKGFEFDGNPVSVWFDETGMRVGYGMSAKDNPVAFFPWSEVETAIRKMVEQGTYMSAGEIFLIDSVERERVANDIYYFFRDGIEEHLEEYGISLHNYPEGHSRICEMLRDNEGRHQLMDALARAKEQLDRGEKAIKWKYVKRPDYLIEQISDLSLEKKEYPAEDVVIVRNEDFITQDEIDHLLTKGSGFQYGSFRIYDYFLAGHDSKDNIDFLKKEYGTGGGTHALVGADHSYEDHDAKGIELKKGDLSNPSASILLNWKVVEQRIRQLVAEDKYLSPEQKVSYELYKQEREIKEVIAEEESEEPEEITEEVEAESEVEEDEVLVEEPVSETEDARPEDIPMVESVDEQPKDTPVVEPEEVMEKIPAENFHITDDALGEGTPKEKFRWNVDAITLLKGLEKENRNATSEEQEILSRYVGWGGLSDAFDSEKNAWASEYQTLKNLLSDQEYNSARESTLNAHYTSPVIIRSIYKALENMRFSKGNILEPAMGIGNFFGMLPNEMKESRLYGVELDSITGRIAQRLYPNADIKIIGFEKTEYPNDFFDVAVGNVPFGQYKVSDKQYDKHNFLIHDYFFAKALDKVRPGGVIAFVTSKGTMDKKNPMVRKYLAQRAELLGAIRLPNTAFKGNAGTEVTSDILFLKKRDRIVDMEPDWVHLSEDEHGIAMNSYFVEHPEMIMGTMELVSGPYGMESTCVPDLSTSLEEQLLESISHIQGEIEAVELDELADDFVDQTIPADPDVKNYSYTLVDDKVYYRENSIMKPVDLSDSMQERIKGMVGIRNCTQELINVQLQEYPDSVIREKQEELNRLYDDFSKKFGRINSQTNKRAFNQDSSYCLLCSLENFDEEGNYVGKADMFSKRTIKRAEVVTSVDTASEALAVSLSEKAKVDLAYMSELSGKDMDTIKDELSGVIFYNPLTDKWETSDAYLSGNVREKLIIAKSYAENDPKYAVNVHALTQVQPKELDASEIDVRIGATWIEPKYVEDFMRETFETPQHLLNRGIVGVFYSDVTGEWNVKGKNADYGNSLVNMTYGTSRRNAYTILEDSLNLKDSRVYDVVVEDGKEKRVLNKKETTIAAQKQESIREAFKDWVFRDPERRETLVAKYNELFNSTRPREYDGSHLTFPGMTPDIELKPHQKNAVAHVLYGDNTLLAHCVGAGKTFEMTAAAMESKRLGLCQKSLFVVPNHLTEQWASDFLRLYPGANILAATKKDFEPANRKKFCSRIATGDYDAVIIGHSQFEKIPLSHERQVAIIERQIDEIEQAIAQVKADNGERYTIKQMEKSRKTLQTRLDKLNDSSRKDNVVTFEQLGVDRLFVDESHNYKNLFLYTKMRNVAGIAQTEAQKSSDMFAKCQYLDELTGGKGVTFATGTPISNSMTELYTNMRYLQNATLRRMGLGHFDSWASSFGETQTAIELAPEGTGYRAKTRFAKFFNLPELISLFKECADIQTADMLHLPVPEVTYENVVLKPSEYQQEMVKSLADRAEAVRDRQVQPYEDNMLKITNDGRKLALDQRLINDMLPDDQISKTSICVEKAFHIWGETKEQKSAQLIFCDLSTPKGDGSFNVYDDIKTKLIGKGVPQEEIAFIHEANTELRKAELFGKVRSGQVRFLLGSTQKMGAGTNVQDRLIALHHLDVPWRPSDIEQREGRIIRQGNQNPMVKIFRYVTEGTFDSYSWQVIENKQKFISQIMTSKSPVRSCEDVDEAALSYAEVKALATGNPYIKEKMDLDIQVSRLKLMKANHTSQRYRLEDNIAKNYPKQIAILEERIAGMQLDIQTTKESLPADKEQFSMIVADKLYTDKKEAGTALVAICKELKDAREPVAIGEYAGFQMAVSFDLFNHRFVMNVRGALSHNLEIGSDPLGNIVRINHVLESMPKQLEEDKTKLETVERQLETAKVEVTKPFDKEAELAEKLERLSELNALLNMDEKGNDGVDIADDEEEIKKENMISKKQPEKKGPRL